MISSNSASDVSTICGPQSSSSLYESFGGSVMSDNCPKNLRSVSGPNKACALKPRSSIGQIKEHCADSHLKEVTQILNASLIIKNVLLIILLVSFCSNSFGQVLELKPYETIWEFKPTDDISSPVTMGRNGSVFFGAGFKVYRVDGKTGSKIWEFKTNGKILRTPKIGPYSNIYVISERFTYWDGDDISEGNNIIYSLNAETGSKNWEFETTSNFTFVSIGPDGTIFFGTYDNKVYAVNGLTGESKWDVESVKENSFNYYSLVLRDGAIFVSNKNKAIALEASSGSRKWEFSTDEHITGPVLGFDGTVFIGSQDQHLYALNPQTGEINWKFKTNGPVNKSAAIGLNGLVYVGSSHALYALDALTGEYRWQFYTSGISPRPIVGPDGKLYLFDEGVFEEKWLVTPKFYALNSNTGQLLWEFEAGHFIYDPVFDADGTTFLKLIELSPDYHGTMPDSYILSYVLSKTGMPQGGLNKIRNITIGLNGVIYGGGDKLYALEEIFVVADWDGEFILSEKKLLSPIPSNNIAKLTISPRWLILGAADSFDSDSEMFFTSYDGKTSAPKVDTSFGQSYISRELKLLNNPKNTWATDYIVGKEYGSLTFHDPILDANKNGHPDLTEFGLPINRTFYAELIQNSPKSGVKANASIHFARQADSRQGYYTIFIKTTIGSIEFNGSFWVSQFTTELTYNTEMDQLKFSIFDTDASGDLRTISAVANYSLNSDGSLILEPFSSSQTINGENTHPIQYNESELKWLPNLNIFRGHVSVKDGDTLSSWPDLIDFTFELSGVKPKKNLSEASTDNDLKSLQQHISIGTNLDAIDSNSWTALTIAAYYGHIDFVETLLFAGANIETKKHEGWNALHEASRYGHIEIVKLLLDNGAYIEAKQKYGMTPLYLAAAGNHTNIINLLISNGAEIQTSSNYERTALHTAAYNGHAEAAKLLIEEGIDFKAKDQDGLTALDLAIQKEHQNVIDVIKEETKPPSIIKHPQNKNAEFGETVEFTVDVSGSKPFDYQWYKDGKTIDGAKTETLALDNLTSEDAGIYSVRIKNAFGKAISRVAVLTVVLPLPIIAQQPQDKTVSLGDNVEFSVNASGRKPFDYQWYKDGKTIDGAKAETLALDNLTSEDAGIYSVRIKNAFGKAISRVAVLTVVLPHPVVTTQPISHTLNIGGSMTFSVAATGTEPLIYRWRRNGVFLGPSTENSTLTLKNVQPEQAGTYRVVVSNTAGEVMSEAAELVVIEVFYTLLWKFKTGGNVKSSPAIGSDGTVYVGTVYKNKVYAINPDGTKKWEYNAGLYVWSSPAIGSDGTVYVLSMDGKVYALDGKGGAKKWEFNTGAEGGISSPSIGADGTVYVGSYDGDVYALNGKTGDKLWKYKTGNNLYSSPAIEIDGIIYVGSADNKVYALNPDGTKKWEFKTGSNVSLSPSIGADGTVYVGSHDYKVYALDGKSGSKKWAFKTERNVYSSPAIGSDGTVYVGSFDKKVYALNPDGTKKWEFRTGDKVYSSPAIGDDGTVYIGSDDGKVYAINSDGTKKWEFETRGKVYSSPAIGSDGTVYVGSDDGWVYALESSSSGPADSPWPMFGQNAQRTGRVLTPQKHELIEINILRTTVSPFTFTFATNEGETYEIQVTQDLKQWSKLGEVNGTSSESKFTDPRQPIVPFKRNYYRVKLVE
jgi:outer membrane protein assembly factor BamB